MQWIISRAKRFCTVIYWRLAMFSWPKMALSKWPISATSRPLHVANWPVNSTTTTTTRKKEGYVGLFESIGRVVIRDRLVGDVFNGQSPLPRCPIRRFFHPSITKWLPNEQTGFDATRHWSHQLMVNCWKQDSSHRPTFNQLTDALSVRLTLCSNA